MVIVKIMGVVRCFTRPVLLFPGMGGSVLRKKHNAEIVFPPSFHQFFFGLDEWKRNMLSMNPTPIGEYFLPEIDTFNFGDKRALDLRSVSPFCINQNNYDFIHQHENIFPVPYDFRKIHMPEYLETDLFPRVKTYIETFGEPVILLAHSTAGVIIHLFLHLQTEEWRTRHICGVVNVSVPFCGLFLVLQCLVNPTWIDKILGIDILRNMGGFIVNMPNSQYFSHPVVLFGENEIVVTDDTHPIQNKSILSSPNTSQNEYFRLLKVECGVNPCLDDVKHKYCLFHEKYEQYFVKSTGVNTHIVYSCGNPFTPVGFRFRKTGCHNTKKQYCLNGGNIMKTVYGEGDGVVATDSLLFPKRWETQTGVFYHNIKNKSHSNILGAVELVTIIEQMGDRRSP